MFLVNGECFEHMHKSGVRGGGLFRMLPSTVSDYRINTSLVKVD